jgi:hypothetical protein
VQEPVKPVRPKILSTPVKCLTREDILSMPHLLHEHEIALIEYHKALDEFHRWAQEGQEHEHECESAA